jgi:hypothetical protein
LTLNIDYVARKEAIMPVTLHWDNSEQTALRWTFSGRWAWDEVCALADDLRHALDSAGHDVDYILDFHAAVMPVTPLYAQPFAGAPGASGRVMVVGGSEYAPVILPLAARLCAGGPSPQVVFLPGMDSVRDFLRQVRPSEQASTAG